MTEQRLQDLLHETVADLTPVDLVDAAWERAQRTRRRRSAVIVGGTAAAVLVVAGVFAIERPDRTDRPDRPGGTPGVGTPVTSPTAPTRTAPDTSWRGAPVWWSPDAEDEAFLDPVQTALPETIDLSAAAPSVETDPIDRALAAFAVFNDSGLERVMLLAEDGTYRSLDVSRLSKVARPNGYRMDPEGDSMLSPDGTALMFPQDGHLMVFDLGDRAWHRVETGTRPTVYATWASDHSIYMQPTAAGGRGSLFSIRGETVGSFDVRAPGTGLEPGTPYGRWRMSPGGIAQSYDMGQDIPVPNGYLQQPEFMVADVSGRPSVLAFLWDPPADGRSKQCCPVAGWLDENTVVYESRKVEPQLVAWTVGTSTFRSVTVITGFTPGQEYYVASWARMWR